MSSYILAYDLGTGGNKATLYDEEGVCLAITFQPYETLYPDVGWHEQRPMDWWQAVVSTTRELLNNSRIDRKAIKCLALSGHSLGVVPLDKRGNLLRETTPIWSDTRAQSQTKNFFRKVDQNEWYKKTGNGFSRECYSVFKMMWYRDNEPDMFSRINKIIGTKDFINYKLTGKLKTDYSYASGSGVYDLLKWNYDDSLIRASGLPRELFLDIVSSTDVVGELNDESSELLGLSKKVKVLCGGVDNSCMALGAGNISEGRVYLSLGSSSWIAVSSKRPLIDLTIKPFVFTHVIPEMFTSAVAIFSAGNSLKWVKDTLCANLLESAKRDGRDPYEVMAQMAKNSPPGANKLLFNPSLAGGSAAHLSTNIRGAYIGLDLSHTQFDIIRSAMEGIALDLRVMLDKLKRLGKVSNEILFVGGGSKSSIWRQIFANIFNCNVVKANIDQDAGALGAAAVAAVGSGMWKDFSRIDDVIKKEDITEPGSREAEIYERILSVYLHTLNYQAEIGDMLAGLEL